MYPKQAALILTGALLTVLFLTAGARAQIVDPWAPPANYYAAATGVGATLKSQLHNIIDGHTVFSYGDARFILPETDEDPNNPSRMLLVYDRASHPTVWDSAATWNREHVWPESRGVGSGGPDQSDLHMLRPSRTSINSNRGNLNFGGAFGQPYGEVFDKGAEVFYPGDADAGMIARQSFYMAVRYDGSDSGTADLELQTGNPSSGGTRMGDLARMLEWHYQAPPDSFERRRNQKVYADYQGNRNPFIDRPEYAWSVFVDQANDSSISLQGASPAVDGGTSLDLDLGRVLVGAPLPAPQSVTLNKSGLDGAYYEVVASGAATSSISGRYNAFRTGAADSEAITVGLNTHTATPGLRSGTVTIDNLDVTTGAGAGRGANDADDVVNVSLSVLDHANPSFSSESDVNLLVYDFGTVTLGAAAPTFSFSLANLASASDFTAGLDLDSISAAGDVNAFSIDVAPFGGASSLPAGAAAEFTARLETPSIGAFRATYTLSFSDEDLPGAASLGAMTLTLSGIVEASTTSPNADFNSDGDVDGDDFLAWQRGLGRVDAPASAGDANGDQLVNAADLGVWSGQFGQAPAASASAVPESASYAGFTMAAAALVVVFRGGHFTRKKDVATARSDVPQPASTTQVRRARRFLSQCREFMKLRRSPASRHWKPTSNGVMKRWGMPQDLQIGLPHRLSLRNAAGWLRS